MPWDPDSKTPIVPSTSWDHKIITSPCVPAEDCRTFNKIFTSNNMELRRPPSVRVDHGYSILVVCLAGASATMTVKTDA